MIHELRLNEQNGLKTLLYQFIGALILFATPAAGKQTPTNAPHAVLYFDYITLSSGNEIHNIFGTRIWSPVGYGVTYAKAKYCDIRWVKRTTCWSQYTYIHISNISAMSMFVLRYQPLRFVGRTCIYMNGNID